MQSAGAQAELFFWLTVEGYRVTAQQQLEAMQRWQKDGRKQAGATKALLKSAALGVYEQYLSDKVGGAPGGSGTRLLWNADLAAPRHAVVTNLPLPPPPVQASPRVQVDQDSVATLGEKLQRDDPTPEIFDGIQRSVRLLRPFRRRASAVKAPLFFSFPPPRLVAGV